MPKKCSLSRLNSRRRHSASIFVGMTVGLVVVMLLVGNASADTWAEKLGYPSGKRVLMLHADDIGMCYEANHAAKEYLTAGAIQSAAMMVPCPWFNEFAAWVKENPGHCVGLHLAMNSEWKFYRWGPVAPRSEVPSMLDREGYLWHDTPQTMLQGKAVEIEREVRAQVERALAAGVKPTHIDTHMGTLYARPDFTAAFFRVAVEYRIPANALEPTPRIIEKFRKRGIPKTAELESLLKNYPLPKLDDFDSVPNGKTYEEKLENFFNLVRSFEPGITEIIFHPSIETEGLKRITGSWQQRVWEARMFSDPAVQRFFEREEIVFTNWKQVMERWEERFGHNVPKPQELAK